MNCKECEHGGLCIWEPEFEMTNSELNKKEYNKLESPIRACITCKRFIKKIEKSNGLFRDGK